MASQHAARVTRNGNDYARSARRGGTECHVRRICGKGKFSRRLRPGGEKKGHHTLTALDPVFVSVVCNHLPSCTAKLRAGQRPAGCMHESVILRMCDGQRRSLGHWSLRINRVLEQLAFRRRTCSSPRRPSTDVVVTAATKTYSSANYVITINRRVRASVVRQTKSRVLRAIERERERERETLRPGGNNEVAFKSFIPLRLQ
jgi:hypothetical protein